MEPVFEEASSVLKWVKGESTQAGECATCSFYKHLLGTCYVSQACECKDFFSNPYPTEVQSGDWRSNCNHME